jgi:predicted aconitase
MANPGTYRFAEVAGYRKTIEEAGAALLSGTCAGLLNGKVINDGVPKVWAMDAAKQDYYITGHCHPESVRVRYGTMEECIDAAVTGKWRGEF